MLYAQILIIYVEQPKPFYAMLRTLQGKEIQLPIQGNIRVGNPIPI